MLEAEQAGRLDPLKPVEVGGWAGDRRGLRSIMTIGAMAWLTAHAACRPCSP